MGKIMISIVSLSPGADLAADGLPHIGAALTHGAHGVIRLLCVIHPQHWPLIGPDR